MYQVSTKQVYTFGENTVTKQTCISKFLRSNSTFHQNVEHRIERTKIEHIIEAGIQTQQSNFHESLYIHANGKIRCITNKSIISIRC